MFSYCDNYLIYLDNFQKSINLSKGAFVLVDSQWLPPKIKIKITKIKDKNSIKQAIEVVKQMQLEKLIYITRILFLFF